MTSICKECGQPIPQRARGNQNKDFCSVECYKKWVSEHKKAPNCYCAVCGKPMYIKPYRLKRTQHGITCSRDCGSKYRSIWFSGKGNHQYGLVGSLNASYKGAIRISVYGYALEEAPGHPFPIDKYEGVPHVGQHRLVVEKNYKMFNPEFFVIINGKHYLKPEYDVHHINDIKTDNRIENLQVLTKSEHSKLHCRQHRIIRDKSTGRIIGVVKLGKNGEPCDGNTVLTSSITKGKGVV